MNSEESKTHMNIYDIQITLGPSSSNDNHLNGFHVTNLCFHLHDLAVMSMSKTTLTEEKRTANSQYLDISKAKFIPNY